MQTTHNTQPLFVLGYPGDVGGASTELWHTLRLWRRYGLPVHLVHTWGDPPPEWRERCAAIGCATHVVNSPTRAAFSAIPGFAGGRVVSFCNEHFLNSVDLLRALRCRLIWVPCMNWLFGGERRLYPVHGPFDAYVCQSLHQLETLTPQLAEWNVPAERIHRVRGWIDCDEFPYRPRPHAAGEPLVVGRVSRPATDKFSTNSWAIYRRVNYRPLQVRVMGWQPVLANAIGRPPEFVETLPPAAEPIPWFLASLHCYCQINGTATENWPRAGLEAMAARVPLVVEARGGWTEMIDHGRSGYLCDSDEELAHWMAHLAHDEDARLAIAEAAYRRLVDELAAAEPIWAAWRRVFASLDRHPKSELRTPKAEAIAR